MKMNRLVLVLVVVSVSLPAVGAATESAEWCYTAPECNATTWPLNFPFCNGSRQSPINIVSSSAQGNASLSSFSFTSYSDNSTMKKIVNTGHTVRVDLSSGVSVSGGGLGEDYTSLQFHLHWGNGSSVPGSEHTVDGKRYPMEMHIVNIKTSLGGNVTAAKADSTGLAALGFFIEEAPGNGTGTPSSWKTLTSYLANITNSGDYVNITHAISLDDLLEGVDRTKYYRYLGSLTTPTCDEAVVWTVFKEPIKVSRDLIDMFSTMIYIPPGASPALLTHAYRPSQALNGRAVETQSTATATTTTPTSGASQVSCFSLGLLALLPWWG